MNKTHTRECRRCQTRYDVLEVKRYDVDSGEYVHTLHAQTPGVPDDFEFCPKCKGRRYDRVVEPSHFAIDRIPDDRLPYLARPPDKHERALTQADFPHYDAGLGAMVQSPEHREWLKSHYPDGVKREEKLVWVGDDLPFDPIAMVDHERSVKEARRERYNEYRSEMLSRPETAFAWDYVDKALAAQDFSGLGITDEQFFGPTHYPPEGELIKQDLSGHLYTDSGWSSDEPQPWVPLALEAAGHQPMLPESDEVGLLEA